MSNKQGRFLELEGLRGVAAIMVASYHYILAFYALALLGVNSGYQVVQHIRYENILYGNPAMVFLSGTFAVAIFFVLSGFVLSVGFFQTGKIDILKKLAAKRYLRLMLPALASILLAFMLIKLGLPHNQQAAALTHSGWLQAGWSFVPHLGDALKDGLLNIFFSGGSGYNNVLWTMTTEFLGSFIVFGFLAFFAQSKYRAVFYGALTVATFNTWLMAFIIGMLMADLYAHGRMKQTKSALFPVLLVLGGLFLGGYPIGGSQGTIYNALALGGQSTFGWVAIYLTFGATMLVTAVLKSTHLTRLFAARFISLLGKYTFSLYLTHLLVLYTLTSYLFVGFSHHFGFNISVLLAVAFSVPVIVVVTYLFERLVDAPSIRLSTLFANVTLGYQKLSPEFTDAFKRAYVSARESMARRSAPSEYEMSAQVATED